MEISSKWKVNIKQNRFMAKREYVEANKRWLEEKAKEEGVMAPAFRVLLTVTFAFCARSLPRRVRIILPISLRTRTSISGNRPLLSGGQLRIKVAFLPTVSRYIWKRRSTERGFSPSCQNHPLSVNLASLSPGSHCQPSSVPYIPLLSGA